MNFWKLTALLLLVLNAVVVGVLTLGSGSAAEDGPALGSSSSARYLLPLDATTLEGCRLGLLDARSTIEAVRESLRLSNEAHSAEVLRLVAELKQCTLPSLGDDPTGHAGPAGSDHSSSSSRDGNTEQIPTTTTTASDQHHYHSLQVDGDPRWVSLPNKFLATRPEYDPIQRFVDRGQEVRQFEWRVADHLETRRHWIFDTVFLASGYSERLLDEKMFANSSTLDFVLYRGSRDVKWDSSPDKYRDGAIRNHFPRDGFLFTKIRSHRALMQYNKQHGCSYRRVSPITYDLLKLDECHDIKGWYRQNVQQTVDQALWFLKRSKGSQGDGVFMTTLPEVFGERDSMLSCRDLSQNFAEPAWHGASLLQLGISNPHLVKGSIYEIRSYLFFASALPAFNIFLFPGHVRRSLRPYTGSGGQDKDRASNTVNSVDQIALEDFDRDDQFWREDKLRAHFMSEEGWDQARWDLYKMGIQRACTHFVQASLHLLEKRPRTFLIASCDVMVTDEFEFLVIEANANPSMHVEAYDIEMLVEGLNIVKELDQRYFPDEEARRGSGTAPDDWDWPVAPLPDVRAVSELVPESLDAGVLLYTDDRRLERPWSYLELSAEHASSDPRDGLGAWGAQRSAHDGDRSCNMPVLGLYTGPDSDIAF